MTDTGDDLLARLRAAQGAPTNGNGAAPLDFDQDLIPAVKFAGPSQDSELDQVLDRLDIVEAYVRWCGKMTPKVGNRRESIMVSCPNPAHPDKNPSAWINLDKGVYTCGTCGFSGGDKFDIAAWHFGFNVPGYKGDGSFPELRRRMAEDLGYVVKRTLGGQEYLEAPAELPPVPAAPTPEALAPVTPLVLPATPLPAIPAQPLAPVLSIVPDMDDEEEEPIDQHVRIEWEDIITPDTFLDTWMRACTIDDLPHEYYFWLGMQALGFAAGTEILLDDFQKVKPNLYVCLYGPTGSGKSRALIPYVSLLEDALPYDEDPYGESTGTKLMPSPASAEMLLKLFSKEILDPATNSVQRLGRIRGLLRVEEFASFVARASRPTNPMKETLIEMYDVLGRDIKHASLSGGAVTAREPFCQMVTTTQPKAIHDFLRRTDVHSGFMNRWVFATGHRRRSRISHGGVQIDATASGQALRGIKQWVSSNPHLMLLQGAALDTWDQFFHDQIVALHDGDNSMLSRVDLTLKKCMILFAMNEMESNPSQGTVEKVIELFPYLRRTLMMFTTDIAFSEGEDCRTKIITCCKRFTEKKNQHPSLRDIRRSVGSQFTGELIARTLKTMIDLGELEELVDRSARGPATKRYAYAG